MHQPRFIAAGVLAIALSGSGAARPPVQQVPGCGVFGAESVVIEFNVTGGGTFTDAGGQVITQNDQFSGKLTLSKRRPVDDCVNTGDWTFKAQHKATTRDLDGSQTTVTIDATIEPPDATMGFVVNPLAGTWLFHPLGFFPVTEQRVEVAPPRTFTSSFEKFPWGLPNTMVPNLPIPRSSTSFQVEVRPSAGDADANAFVWRGEVKVTASKMEPVWIDPCWIYFRSQIGCEQQTLGESVPLTGSSFSLHYQSDRFRLAPAGQWSPRALSAAEWSLTVHHSWDPAKRTLYLGDGSRRTRPNVRDVPAGPGGPPGAVLVASAGGGETFLFDQAGRHLKTFDTITGAVRFEFLYNTAGSLTTVRDAFGRQLAIERDGTDRPTAVVAPNGDRTTFEVGSTGRLSRVVNPAGGAYTFEYSAQGWLTSVVDPLQRASKYTYDDAGRLIRDESPGRVVTLSHTEGAEGTRVTVSDGGISTTHVWFAGAAASQRTVVFPDGTKTTADGSRAETTITMRDGATLHFGRVLDPILGPSGTAGSSEYNSPGGISRSGSSTITVERAPDGNPLLPIRRETVTSVGDGRYRSVYERENRTITLTTPAERTTRVSYSAAGQMSELARRGFASARLSYDALGRLTDIRSGDAAVERRMRLEYDERGRVHAVIDPAGRTREFAYDALNRVTSVRFAGGELRYRRDALGRVIGIAPPGRPEHQVSYAAAGGVAAYTLPPVGDSPAAKINYEYTPAGTLASVLRADGRQVRLGRDTAGRIASVAMAGGTMRVQRSHETGLATEVASPSGVTKAFTRDGALLTAVTYSGGIAGRVELHYGSLARLSEVAVAGAGGYEYHYDDDGLLIAAGEQTYARDPDSGLLTKSSLRTIAAEWTHNAFGESITHVERAGDRVLFRAEYTRDALGRIAAKTESIEGTSVAESYQYDDAGRLTRVLHGAQEIARYEYDANGNRTRVVDGRGTAAATFDAQDRLLTHGDDAYSYSAQGELTSRRSAAGATTFVFDELSELRSARTAAGRSIEYLADENGKRIGRRVDGQLREGFLYHPDGAPLAWIGGDGGVKAVFVYGRRAHVPDSMIKEGVTYRIITDAIGSVRLVVDAQSGAVAQRIDYDPFGRVIRDSSPGFQPFGFAGGLPDPDTGLVRMGVRDYDPDTGRFTSKDPIGFAGGSFNLYAYASGDPISHSDPSGLFTVEVSFGVIGGSITIGEEGVSGSVKVGTGTPEVNVTSGSEVFIPANADEGFFSRDAKVTLEGKAAVEIGSWGGASISLTSEELKDQYNYYCGEFGEPEAKAEVCLVGYCADTKGELKNEAKKTKEFAEHHGKGKVELGAEVSAKVEFLIMRFGG